MSATRLWESLSVGGIEDAEALKDSKPFEINTVVTLCRKTVGKSAPLVVACISSILNGATPPWRTSGGCGRSCLHASC